MYALGAHTASLGLAITAHSGLPAPFTAGAFVGQHGSWNRRPPSGYRVIFIPFSDGKPAGEPVDVLTGFLNAGGQARGRPVGVALDSRGGLLVLMTSGIPFGGSTRPRLDTASGKPEGRYGNPNTPATADLQRL
jgi:glucose/arabinose dehydrogenase